MHSFSYKSICNLLDAAEIGFYDACANIVYSS